MSGRTRAWGAVLLEDGSVRFRLWAPHHAGIHLRLLDTREDLPMQATGAGWHELITARATHGFRYLFVLEDGKAIMDPASSFQPDGLAGPSEVIDPGRWNWTDGGWSGRPWHEAVIYELHVGAFTPEGTFRGVQRKLPHLAALGVTAIELMPIGEFAGSRSWGYDGVGLYSPASAYGRPEHLQALVEAAHGAGIMVLLDVVYNHFGPQGNRLGDYAPGFFTERHQTPWGAGIAFDGEDAVRRFFIDNALYWLEAYRLDGLRLDAVHAIADESRVHVIDELAREVHARFPHRHVHLILENENNEARRLARLDHQPALFTAQWNDDVHHVLHTAATGESGGYYADYAGDTERLGRALAQGFAFQGEYMAYCHHPRGEPSAHLPPQAFVSFIQNHDQVGNRALGERIGLLAPAEAVRAIATVYLLAPQIPMLFMGEEWASTQPFPFFCDFDGALRDAVVQGRRDEFARFPEFADESRRESIPDPCDPATFESARLRWKDSAQPTGQAWVAWYTRLLAARRESVMPLLPGIESGGNYCMLDGGTLQIYWTVIATGERLALHANLSPVARRCAGEKLARVIWQEGGWNKGMMDPWCVCWSLGQGGSEEAVK